MISANYCRVMARYNAWQNTGLSRALEALPWEQVVADGGAFFGSLWGTANHLLWGDTIWMSRLAGWDAPQGGISGSERFTPDLAAWQHKRSAADAGITRWAHALADEDLEGDLSWFSGAAGREVKKPLAFCVTHFFNHQTHHRGQMHALLTQAGLRPRDTDLFFLPEDT